jgi:Plasmid pRiA4b ORF-3-like protein
VQLKVWLLGISPMIWRRLLAPSSCTLEELHGIIQVAMGWESFHLYQFCVHAVHYGSWELAASSPQVTLAQLRLRKGARFIYEYDLNIPWQHEIRIEDRLPATLGKVLPCCTGGAGACPPEDCGGPEGYLAGLDEAVSVEAYEDFETFTEIFDEVVRDPERLRDDETRSRLEEMIERSKARERAQGQPFSRRAVNARLRDGEHRVLMYQQG